MCAIHKKIHAGDGKTVLSECIAKYITCNPIHSRVSGLRHTTHAHRVNKSFKIYTFSQRTYQLKAVHVEITNRTVVTLGREVKTIVKMCYLITTTVVDLLFKIAVCEASWQARSGLFSNQVHCKNYLALDASLSKLLRCYLSPSTNRSPYLSRERCPIFVDLPVKMFAI